MELNPLFRVTLQCPRVYSTEQTVPRSEPRARAACWLRVVDVRCFCVRTPASGRDQGADSARTADGLCSGDIPGSAGGDCACADLHSSSVSCRHTFPLRKAHRSRVYALNMKRCVNHKAYHPISDHDNAQTSSVDAPLLFCAAT